MLWAIDIRKKNPTQYCPAPFIAAAPFCYSVKQEQLLLSERGQLLWTVLHGAQGDVDHRSLLWNRGSWISWEFSRALDATREGKGCCRGSSMHSMSPLHIHLLEMIQAHEITWQLPIQLGWYFKALLHSLHLSASSAHNMLVRRSVPSPQKPN